VFDYKMSEYDTNDWKLRALTVVKLHRKNINTFVSLHLEAVKRRSY